MLVVCPLGVFKSVVLRPAGLVPWQLTQKELRFPLLYSLSSQAGWDFTVRVPALFCPLARRLNRR